MFTKNFQEKIDNFIQTLDETTVLYKGGVEDFLKTSTEVEVEEFDKLHHKFETKTTRDEFFNNLINEELRTYY